MNKIVKWENKIIYQIFPRSFMDANNDGNGDLQGIIAKIPYLKWLGIDAIWLCPIYDTEFVDAGYDVLNYYKVWPSFGTLEDFKTLAKVAREAKIDLIMDLVLNHTSHHHQWFKKALASEKNLEHNYYIWRDHLSPSEAKAKSIFGGSAWEYVPQLKKYYFHLFAKEQVDLNWKHPDTQAAMAQVINFWYDLGVRGFRLDAIKHVVKDFKQSKNKTFSWCQGIDQVLKDFQTLAFKDKPDAFTMGEASGISLLELHKYGLKPNQLAANYFNFSIWNLGWSQKTGRNGYSHNYTSSTFAQKMKPIQEDEAIEGKLITNFMTNHDTSRAISRWGNTQAFWAESAKSLAMFLFALKGIPCLYQGEEIGMLNPIFKSRSEFRDVDAQNAFSILVDQKQVYTEQELINYHNVNSRDCVRTPMQWNEQINAGFNQGAKPWIKLSQNTTEINVENQKKDPNSILNFYQQLIKTRKDPLYQSILVPGTSKIKILNSGVFQIIRTSKLGAKIVTWINFSDQFKSYSKLSKAQLLHCSYRQPHLQNNHLRPYESLMFYVKK